MAASSANENSDKPRRTVTSFRNFVSQNHDSQFPAESGRYHLYISYACPWASRCLAVLKLKGLDKAISFTVSSYIIFLDISIKIITKAISFTVLFFISLFNLSGEKRKKTMSIWDGFFPTQIRRFLELTETISIVQKASENSMTLLA